MMTTSTVQLPPPATAPAPATTAKPPPPVAVPISVPELETNGIFYPETDGEPLPDGEYQAPIYQEILTTLSTHFRGQPRTIRGGSAVAGRVYRRRPVDRRRPTRPGRGEAAPAGRDGREDRREWTTIRSPDGAARPRGGETARGRRRWTFLPTSS